MYQVEEKQPKYYVSQVDIPRSQLVDQDTGGNWSVSQIAKSDREKSKAVRCDRPAKSKHQGLVYMTHLTANCPGMGQNSSAVRSSPRPLDPPSRQRSPGKEATNNSSETYLFPPSADGGHVSTLHPTYAKQPSASSHHELEVSKYANPSFDQQPALSPPSYPPHSASNISGPDPYGTYLMEQQPLQIPEGGALTVPAAHYQSQGMFSGSQHLSFSDNTFIDNSITSDNLMKEFLQYTIIGAEFDSSDRHPPPRCQPGTRLAILKRCKTFLTECTGAKKMRWFFGPAGAGKSGIMQVVAEETPADASVFLSNQERKDGTKIVTTIAYQLAVKYEPYRQFVRNEISRDPSLLRKSLPAQFQNFIIDPFIHRRLFDPSHRLLIIIDGLDECDNPFTQVELLRLISEFCISYTTSPIVWFIASRPEPHITSFFDDVGIAPAYTKEKILTESDEACEKVQRYLRREFTEIKRAYPALKRKKEWPSEFQFTKIATAAGGLFAYASTVIRYIDSHHRYPITLLGHVLEAIDASGKEHPTAQLDALYAKILSNIPTDAMINTRKLLLLQSEYGWRREKFRSQCNRLGLTEDAAYSAVSYLHAVLKVPKPDKADKESLGFFHKSFPEFLFDFKRSRFCRRVKTEVRQIQARGSLRIVEQVPDNFDWVGSHGSEDIKCAKFGYLKNGPGLSDRILLSWPGDMRALTTDTQLRLDLYRNSMGNIARKFMDCDKPYRTMSFFHFLTTRFIATGVEFPFYELRDFVFDDFRAELTRLGELKQVPLRTLDRAAICGGIEKRFMTPSGKDGKHSDPWHPACKHKKKVVQEVVDGLQPSRGWSTSFRNPDVVPRDDTTAPLLLSVKAGKNSHWESIRKNRVIDECLNCPRQFARHFVDNLNELATVFVDLTGMCYGEFSFVDQDDGMSGWRYRFFHSGPPSCIN